MCFDHYKNEHMYNLSNSKYRNNALNYLTFFRFFCEMSCDLKYLKIEHIILILIQNRFLNFRKTTI